MAIMLPCGIPSVVVDPVSGLDWPFASTLAPIVQCLVANALVGLPCLGFVLVVD